MSSLDWAALADGLGLEAGPHAAHGQRGRFPAGLTSRGTETWLGLIVANPASARWTLTRRWEPQARSPRRPDARTIRFRQLELTERYVGAADRPGWFREALSADAVATLVTAADANRLGACRLDLHGHVLRAYYRAPADRVPDLAETLTSLTALAECVDDGGPAPPDAASVLLWPDAGDAPSPFAQLRRTPTGLVCVLPKPAGLRARLAAAPEIAVDWQAGELRMPETPPVPLSSVRQVTLAIEGDHAMLSVLDLGGGVVCQASGPATEQDVGTTAPAGPPPFVCVRAGA